MPLTKTDPRERYVQKIEQMPVQVLAALAETCDELSQELRTNDSFPSHIYLQGLSLNIHSGNTVSSANKYLNDKISFSEYQKSITKVAAVALRMRVGRFLTKTDRYKIKNRTVA